MLSMFAAVVGYCGTFLFPGSAWASTLVTPLSLIIFIFFLGVPDNSVPSGAILAGMLLGVVSTGCWAFVEGRMEWQALITRKGRKIFKESPLAAASIFSKILFTWNLDLLRWGYQNPIEQEDLPPLAEEETVSWAYQRYRAIVNRPEKKE